MFLIDPFGRRINYLRLSVTNRCNLRCVYCLPAVGFAPNPDLLSDEEMLCLVRIFAGLGVDKIRVTGGEPLVRPGVISLIKHLCEIRGIGEVSLSTNALLLEGMAADLKAAGLKRVNISLDSLREERFRAVTRLGSLKQAWAGVMAALKVFSPVKLNVVIMRGINDDEIPDFVRLAYSFPLHVRFIELMPIGETGFFSGERWVPLAEIRARCGELEPMNGASPVGFGPATYFKAPGATGTIGFIGALSCNFCPRCNRLRMTADGRLLPCLASDLGVDLKNPLRAGASEGEIEGLIRRIVTAKPERHRMDRGGERVRETFMCALGG